MGCYHIYPLGPFRYSVDTLTLLKNNNEILRIPFERRYVQKMSAKFYNVLPNDTLKNKIFEIKAENFQLIDTLSCYIYNARVIGFNLLLQRKGSEEIIDIGDYSDITKNNFEKDSKITEMLESLNNGDQLIFESIIVIANDGMTRKIGQHTYYVGW